VSKVNVIKISERYRDRETSFLGIWKNGEWRFKLYAITHPQNTIADDKTLGLAKEFARDSLRRHAEFSPAYGLGYIILHRGMDANFIVINWWAGENMLSSHPFLAPLEKPYDYKEITATGLNVCVWDVLVHFHERNAWVEHILSPSSPNPEGYMQSVMEIRP
jgi:hypothetical protein